MKNYKIPIIFLLILVSLSSCMKEVGDFTIKGEAITNFELTSPDNNDTLTINTSVPDATIIFSWDDAESGLNSEISYSIIFDKDGNDFSNPLWTKHSDNDGESKIVTLTYKELLEIYNLSNNGEVANVSWNIIAENGSDNKKMAQVANSLKIKKTEYGIGNFNLISPIHKSIVQIDGNKENDLIVFDWEDATSESEDISYMFYLDNEKGDFKNPLLSIPSDNNGQESKLSLTNKKWKKLLDENNIKDGTFHWTVKAISSELSWMNDIFSIFIEIINWKNPIYIVGEATTVGWNIDEALEMNFVIPNVWVGVYELKAGADFKFFPEKGSWNNGIGADQFETFIGCSDPENGNINNSAETDGIKYIVVDLNSKTLTVSNKPKILGGSIIAGWDLTNSINMQMVEHGIYDTYQYITTDGYGFKFVPTRDSWDGDFGASKTTEGLLDQAEEENLTVPSDNFYRVRVNMNNFTYSVTETSWGIIGSATPEGWENDTDLEFTAQKGEYTWSITTSLNAGDIKFRANDNWDINFGDTNNDGSLEYNGDNIPVSSAGEYTISLTLNSETGFTYNIIPQE